MKTRFNLRLFLTRDAPYTAIMQEHYKEALEMYSRALEEENDVGQLVAIFCNRSLAALKLGT